MYTLFDTQNDLQSDSTIKSSGLHHQTHLGHQKSTAEMCLVVGPTRFNGWITLWVISSVKKCVPVTLLCCKYFLLLTVKEEKQQIYTKLTYPKINNKKT